MLEERQLLLSTLPPTRGQERLALVAAVLLLVIFLVTLPFAYVEVGRLDAYVPMVATVTFLNDTITSALLFAQFAVLRTLALLVLATGYLLTGLLVVPYALTYPGAFSPSGLLGAGLSSTAWLFASWHLLFPAMAGAYALLQGAKPPRQVAHAAVHMAILASITSALCIVAGATWLVTAHHDLLPAMLRNSTEFSSFWNYLFIPGALVLCVSVVALLCVRRRSVLDLWLLVVAWAWLLKSIIIIPDAQRYSVAWYANSAFAVSAATFVLIVLLSETTMIYARLALSVMAQRRERETRLMTMDAVAASIAHEINQPLAAIVNNGGAGLHWLAQPMPEIGKATETLTAIVEDGHRAGQIIESIRAIFRRDEPEKGYLDINEVIREVVLLARSEFRHHGITVESALDPNLPPIKAQKIQLQQVLLNLIGNATDAMDAVTSRPRLLRLRTELQDCGDVLVTVEDTGTGIDAKDCDRIFDPLYTTKSSGMGLGLPICRSIIDAHGGRMWATPGIAGGAVFRFVLPAGDQG